MIPPPLAGMCSEPVRAITVRPAVIVTAMWQVKPLSQTAGRPPVPLLDTSAARPAIPMWGGTVLVGDVASTLPLESSACTANTPIPVGADTALSNPPFGAVKSGDSALGLGPASTRHDDTVVAPFQLAHTWVVPSLLGAAAIAGGVVGCPLQANL